jgi:GT2 family glycosyltransferase
MVILGPPNSIPNITSIDIVIVNFNSTDHLLRCLASIYDSPIGISAKIFVQDNASEDGVDRVLSMFPKVLLTKNSSNMGFSRAVNKGLRQGSAPYILLLNPDSLIEGSFFEEIFHYMEEKPEVGVLGPKILNPDGSVQGSARAFPNFFTGLFGRSSLLSRWFPNNLFTRRNVLTGGELKGISPVEVDWVSGACMVVRRKAVEAVGLMDEQFFMYWEDADWCARMRRKGWKVIYFPEPRVLHYVGASSSMRVFRSIADFHKSAYKLFYKYSEGWMRALSPLVAVALASRLILAIIMNKMGRFSKK